MNQLFYGLILNLPIVKLKIFIFVIFNCQGKIRVISGYAILRNHMKFYVDSRGNESTYIRFSGVFLRPLAAVDGFITIADHRFALIMPQVFP
jgi:hypothetical protein